MTNIEDEFLGPFIYNSTIVCLNASRIMSYNNANFSPSSSPLGERVATYRVTSILTNKLSLSSSKPWWPHPVSSGLGGWHGSKYRVFLEHILRCHDHNCDPREYRCSLHCYKYGLDVEQIMEENHFPSLNCYSQLSWEIRELNKILLMVQRPATFLYIFTCSQRIKQLDRFCTDLYRLITDLSWEYHLQIVRSQDKSKLNEPTNYFHSSNWDLCF